MTDDTTYELGGRPYSPRELMIGEVRELVAKLPSGDDVTPMQTFDGLIDAVVYALIGPDGEHPDREAVEAHMTVPEALELYSSYLPEVA